ncbi:hypothetical protein ABID99_003207 [Mucilaginibacter sp. OAE612]
MLCRFMWIVGGFVESILNETEKTKPSAHKGVDKIEVTETNFYTRDMAFFR